ncbi:FAD-dependent oxidoreductase [Clostridium sp. MCC353]|uniref:FAD-dependent oxidoreductase n=1 Tax=Clostridium sp. MCC353 TaxID=2592646 RepID=UPI001C03152C|nr:FAD-dependent oxidoreductase [Clostridium sp. MCC353]MBT9777811.1 FAD-dependent oxidoreductase [Clostridium sp. MCC353]
MQVTEDLYDVIIVGAGPAGLSAAIYMARAKYKVLVLEKEHIGGQITITSEIVNYPGVERTSGNELTHSMRIQAEAFGAEFAIGEVLDMELKTEIKTLHTTKGNYRALGIILATGANPRKLGFKGEKEFQGRGVAYCATCDGEFFTGKEVFVIGGGFAAVEEGIFLTKYAEKVTLIVREEDFTCAKTVSDQLKRQDKISSVFNTEIMEVSGKNAVTYVRFKNNQTGEEWSRDAKNNSVFGVFVFAGYVPNTGWIRDVEIDPHGYIITDRDQKTSLDGVYAAGDVCIKNLRQVVTAVSDGAVAATSLEKYVSELHHKLDLPELVRKQEETGRTETSRTETGQTETGHSGSIRPGETPSGRTIPANGISAENRTGPEQESDDGHGFFSSKIKKDLEPVFAKFQNKVIVKAWLDDTSLSGEIGNFMGELEDLTEKVICEKIRVPQEERSGRGILPAMEICREDGSSSGIFFHGVPGGHEFNSFIIALYNTAGPGQQAEPEIVQKLEQVHEKTNIKVMVSLSCTMCPEVVMAAQKAASLSDYIEAEMIDLMHYPDLKEQYAIMSVPCMVINDSDVYFGKKSLAELADILTKN